MSLQSAISPTPLEKFSNEDDISDEESINLRLSDGEDEDAGKKENQKTDSDNTTANLTADLEEEILNRFDTADPDIDSAIDEDALLNDKQDDTPKQNEKTEEAVDNDNDNVPENATEKEEEKEQQENEEKERVEDNVTEPESNSMLDTERVEMEEDSEKLSGNNDSDELHDVENVDESEELRRSNNADRMRDLESVTKDLKDTVDTEDLLQVTDVKEADAANESSSSSSSSEKDDSEEVAEQNIDDNNEREDDNDDLIDRPSESMDCGDMMDIEENNPLGVEVSEEMDKDYENLLNSEKSNELSKELESASTEKESNIENVAEQKAEESTKSNEVLCNGDASTAENETLNEKINVSDEPHISEPHENTDVNIKTVTDEGAQTSPLSCAQSTLHNGTCDKRDTKSVKRSLSECETEIGSKKIRLTESQVPIDHKIVVLQTLPDFMKSKPLKKLSRRNVEEFCIQKICEVLGYKSEIGELRHKLQKQEQMMEFWKKETTAMTKQVKDLEIVNKKLLNELKLKQDSDAAPVPVKITRSVGLQVKMETYSTKRIARGGSEVYPQLVQSPIKSVGNNAVKTVTSTKPVSPQVIRQNKETTTPILSATLLSQALTKDILPQNNSISSTTNGTSSTSTGNSTNNVGSATTAETKGVIDLTDEDDKTPPTTAVTTSTSNTTIGLPHAKAQTNVRTPAGIAIVTSKPTTTGGSTTNTAPKFMYVLQPSPQMTQSTDLSKPGGTKAFMFRLPNGVLGSTNGILPTLQNGGQAVPQTPLRPGQQAKLQAPATATNVVRNRSVLRHPAPLPLPPAPPALTCNTRKPIPPKPQLSIRKSGQGIVLSWKLPYSLDSFEVIASYQLYAYQETSAPPSTEMWRKVGDVKALALPMACTLTQFADGNKYYFAVRAVDVLKRIGPFSDPEPISL